VWLWPRQGLAVIMFCNLNLSMVPWKYGYPLFDFVKSVALQMLHGDL